MYWRLDAMTQKFKVSMIFHRWLTHGYAWVVTSWWYHPEKVSGTARVARYILYSNFYDMYSSSEIMGAVLIDLAVIFWVHYMFDTCSRSTRPLSYTGLFKKMQRMSVRDLDKMKPFHEKKERDFQVHSFERNDDNLSQTGRSETGRQTCSWCPTTRSTKLSASCSSSNSLVIPFYMQLNHWHLFEGPTVCVE